MLRGSRRQRQAPRLSKADRKLFLRRGHWEARAHHALITAASGQTGSEGLISSQTKKESPIPLPSPGRRVCTDPSSHRLLWLVSHISWVESLALHYFFLLPLTSLSNYADYM